MADLVSPSESLMWIEPVKNEPAVAYLDGHCQDHHGGSEGGVRQGFEADV